MSDSEHLDKKVLDSIRSLMPARFDGLIKRYLESTSVYIDMAIQSAAARNAHDVTSAMHAIKSSSASLGLIRIAQAAKDIEAAADAIANGEEKDWVPVAGNLEVLGELLQAAETVLAQELNRS